MKGSVEWVAEKESSPGVSWRVDLHSHTRFSPDSRTRPEDLVERAREVGLSRLAITDHNTIDGALAARRLDPELVIVGEEISTLEGELLAYFLDEAIPPRLTIQETIRRLREQGAAISVSHPADKHRGTSSIGIARLLEIVGLVDAIEVFNARCLRSADNQAALEVAVAHGKAGTAGSDAHTLPELGSAWVVMPPFEADAASFLASLSTGTPFGVLTGLAPHLGSSLARWFRRPAPR